MTDYEKYCRICNEKFVKNDERLKHTSDYCPSCLADLEFVDTSSCSTEQEFDDKSSYATEQELIDTAPLYGTFENPSNVDNIDEKIEDDDRPIINESIENKAIKTVRHFSWIYLLCSIIVSLYILYSFGIIEVPIYSGSRLTKTGFNAFGIGLAIGIFLQGILIHGLLIVIGSITESLIIIRNNAKS